MRLQMGRQDQRPYHVDNICGSDEVAGSVSVMVAVRCWVFAVD